MTTATLFQKLHAAGLISDASLEKVSSREKDELISVHWELKTLLYLGVLLLSSGLGILVYKNIDTIGHQAILAFIALVTAACFYYCAKTKLPYSTEKVASPNPFFDYVLLLGSLTFLTFLAYLQYQYNVFGNRYGLATFIPMVVLFFIAYYFDHLGVLCLAITNFAAWAGLTITPLHILESNNFADTRIIFTGIAVGILLLAVAWFTQRRKIKLHFEFTYTNFGTHILFIALLAAMFHYESSYFFWLLPIGAFAFYSYTTAIKNRSFYFIVVIVLYSYIALGFVVLTVLQSISVNENMLLMAMYIGALYFIVSGIGLVLLLIRLNKKLKAHDSL
ncbi:MAG TPA: DUF2157 domain-containing protein [Phnomibacter sp.]|nr:DUF2157 domain-containing protein [Phnomibacter sp.]